MPEADRKPNSEPNLPWVEKYRPKVLSELVSHEEIRATIQRFLNQNRLPHLLLYGPPGTGKTTTILAIARQIYSSREFPNMVLELNASDDRGIGIVRNSVLTFASTRPVFQNKFKLVILDEADSMTQDAQNALRRIIEKYTENTRFCLICNYLSKIIPAIQSRCTRYRFGPLTEGQIYPRLEHIIEQETVNIDKGGRKALVTLSGGDMRKVINVLQSVSMSNSSVITEEIVYKSCGQPQKKDVRNILTWLVEEDFLSALSKIRDLKYTKGIALQDIITQVHPYVVKGHFGLEDKIEILEKLSDIEEHLSNGASEHINLTALVSVFVSARKNYSDTQKA